MPGGLDIASAGLSENPIGLSVDATLSGIESAVGLINSFKTKKEAAELAKTRPVRQISPLVGENLSLAENELGNGMSSKAQAAYNAQLDRQQAGSLSAILRGGGDVNNISDVYGAGEEGRQRLAMITDQLRLKQIDNLVKARDNMVDEEDKNFLFNKYAPWADKSQAVAQQRQAANQQIWSGLQTFTGALSGIAGEKKPNNSTATGTNGSDYSGLGNYAPESAGVRYPSTDSYDMQNYTEDFPT